MADRIHLSKADVTEVEEKYVMDALRSGWIAPLGPDTDAFEAEIASYVGVEHALALNSGTAALHLSLLEVGAAPGKVVVLPSMTFSASANAVVYTGATPVFVDSLEEDANVDPRLMLHAIDDLRAEGADVCAAMTVDLFGRCCDYEEIEHGLSEREIPLVEDAAEALGATYQNRAAGSFGRAAALSFNGNKIMTTSGGGMLISDDAELIAHARKVSTQAREPVAWYEHEELGYNFRLSNILAALGRGQLARLDEMLSRRREIRTRYQDAVGAVEGMRMLGADETLRSDNCWLSSFVIDEGLWPDSIDHLIGSLHDDGIEVRHLWKPMHLQPFYRANRMYEGGVSERLFRRGIHLPSGSALSDDQVERVISALLSRLGCA